MPSEGTFIFVLFFIYFQKYLEFLIKLHVILPTSNIINLINHIFKVYNFAIGFTFINKIILL